MGKAAIPPYQPGVYRDDPDRDDAASTSSAVLLGDIDYADEDLPSYSDHPTASYSDEPNAGRAGLTEGDALRSGVVERDPYRPLPNWNIAPPQLPFSTHDMDFTEVRTRFPDYSTNTGTLFQMIRDQARFPPTYFVNIHGSHSETSRQGNKETKKKVTDFNIRINLTNLLTNNPGKGGKVELLPDNKRGYRGGRIPVFKPTVGASDVENVDNTENELLAWCESFVSNPAGVKSFTLKREVINHDTKQLEQLLRSAIAATHYRGHVKISFPLIHQRVIVYSPGKINEWRITTWIRWVFYLTFLWIFAWPTLFFLTHKYDVVKAVYPYADVPKEDGGNRHCVVMSEVEFYNRWQSAIKRAALSRMKCEDKCLDEEYRVATANADARGEVQSRTPTEVPRTGNALADGALGFLHAGLRVAEGFQSREWGADS